MTAARSPTVTACPAPAAVTLSLKPHPGTPAGPVQAVEASLCWCSAGPLATLELRYRIRGRIAALRMPAPQQPGPADGLWQALCLEAFFGAGDGSYHEFNFSPSGQWAAYRFSATRIRDVAPPGLAVEQPLQVERSEHVLGLTATLPRAALPPLAVQAAGWRVGLSAVIEPLHGPISYWALAHPAPRPDFHHAGGWLHHAAPP